MSDATPVVRNTWGAFFAARMAFLAWLALAVTLAGRGARWHWTLDLVANFALQLWWLALVCLPLIMRARRWYSAGVALLALAINGWLMGPDYWTPRAAAQPGTSYRALLANVLCKNNEHAPLVRLIQETQPDFFAIVEIDKVWLDALADVRKDYPYAVEHPRGDNFGLGLFSRHPIRNERVRYLLNQPEPVITATLDLDGEELFVIVAHPIPPVGEERSAQRNLQLVELAKLAQEATGPRMLLGDLNITPWSPHFQELLTSSGLRDARLGFGVQGSWPYGPAPLRIPIDHTLVSPEIIVWQRRVERSISSDHRPILLDWQFRR